MTAALSGLPGADRGGALAGLLVLELAETFAGELAGGLLADQGATVIKIEPAAGSPTRRRGPGLPGEDSLYFQSENRGKLSVRAEASSAPSHGSRASSAGSARTESLPRFSDWK